MSSSCDSPDGKRAACSTGTTSSARTTCGWPRTDWKMSEGGTLWGHRPNLDGPATPEFAKSRTNLEAPPGIEPGMEVLQTSALPLGDGAPWRERAETERLARGSQTPESTPATSLFVTSASADSTQSPPEGPAVRARGAVVLRR